MVTRSSRISVAAQANDAPGFATAVLQASGSLWQAQDREAVAAEAAALLAELVPGVTVERCQVDSGLEDNAFDARHSTRILLFGQDALRVTAPGDDYDALIRAAAELVRVRIDMLDQRNELAESVERLGQSERLQRALYAIAEQASAAGTDLTPMYEALHVIVDTLMYAENFYIALYDAKRDGVWFPYFADSVDPEPPLDSAAILTSDDAPIRVWSMANLEQGPTWYLIREGRPLMGSLEAIGQQVKGPFRAAGGYCKDLLGVPLLNGTDVVGCIVVQSYDQLNQYDDRDKELLIYVAQHIQITLERRRAHIELEHRVEERTAALRDANQVLQKEVHERQRSERLQAALFRIAELAGSTDSIDEFYAAVHRVVGGLLDARNFYIALLSDDGTQLTFPYRKDQFDDGEAQLRDLGDGLTEYVLRQGTALLADVDEVERLCDAGYVTRHGAKSKCWLGVPLVCGESTVGALAVQSYSAEHNFTLRDQELLTFVSYHIANALERKRAAASLQDAFAQLEGRVKQRTHALAHVNRDLRSEITERERVEQRLKYQTLHDSLTGLPNRTLFLQRLEQALDRYHKSEKQGFAVLFMDLDRFKVINDSEGHLVGDDLLIQVGKRIQACLKKEDMVARLGGDEFSVLLESVEGVSSAVRIAERIIDTLSEPFQLGAKELFTSASLGITLAAPHYQSPDELLRDSDAAMYRAKAEGRNRCEVFDDEMRQEAVALLEVQNDLRRGLTRNEFVPYYQPVVDLENGNVVGYEALVRWHHPQRGLLLPGKFLGVAEDMGASAAIDWQIYTQVCRDANALAGRNNAFVSVNLSAHHFSDPAFDQRLLALLAEHDVLASRLYVEVTEHVLLENTAEVNRILSVLHQAGVSISLDDFGTGYSSLSYLHRYPLQTLKIDQSFVANLVKGADDNRDAVIRAILAMAENLSINVIAEGVETPRQRDLLYDLGCRHVQGFLYSKAQPAAMWTGGDTPCFVV